MELDRQAEKRPVLPFAAGSLRELRGQLLASRQARFQRVQEWLSRTPADRLDRQEEEGYLDLRLYTAAGKHFTGQFVEDQGRLVYASLTARPSYLEGARGVSGGD
jgi:hypothetical protein